MAALDLRGREQRSRKGDRQREVGGTGICQSNEAFADTGKASRKFRALPGWVSPNVASRAGDDSGCADRPCDFNVMPTEQDVYKPERWLDDALIASDVRAAYFRVFDQGWIEALCTVHPDETIYTFFDDFFGMRTCETRFCGSIISCWVPRWRTGSLTRRLIAIRARCLPGGCLCCVKRTGRSR